MKQKALTLVEISNRSILSKDKQYAVNLFGKNVEEIHYNMTGYVGYIPLPNGASLALPERGISTYKAEIAKVNREWMNVINSLKKQEFTIQGLQNVLVTEGQNIPNGKLLNTADDLDWLYETHLRSDRPESIKSALIVGNEDAPEQIWLGTESLPLTDSPFQLKTYQR